MSTDTFQNRKNPLALLLLVVFCIAMVILPFVVPGFTLFQITMMLIMAIAVLGLNLLVGYNGQLSLGHGAIYGIGAYATAILMEFGGLAWWVCIPLSGIICLVFGFMFGWPALRLKGPHLALATFALALVMPQILRHRSLEEWTGGVQGLMIFRDPVPKSISLNNDQWFYFITLFVTAIMFLAAWNLLRGRIGRAMIAIREQPVAAAAMGVNVPIVKATTFGVSALYTGVAGSLSALAIEFVSPDSFGLMVSIFMLVGVVIGGIGTIPGALIGAAFIQFVPNFAESISQSAPSAIYALVLLIAVFVMPNGVVGLVRSANKRLNSRNGGSRQPATHNAASGRS